MIENKIDNIGTDSAKQSNIYLENTNAKFTWKLLANLC